MLIPLFKLLARVAVAVDFLALTLLAWTLAWLPGARGSRWYVGLFRSWCRGFVRLLGVRIHLHQHYAGSLPARYILIANHPSAFEDIGIPALFPVVSLAKIEVGDWWIFGRISRAAGTLYVRREDGDSRRAALQAMIDALAAGHNLALYPEGGCRGRRLFDRFQRGAFAASQATGVPVLPVYLHYEAAEDFEWQGQSLPRKIWQMASSCNRRVNLHVFDAVAPVDFADENTMKDEVYRRYREWDRRFHEA